MSSQISLLYKDVQLRNCSIQSNVFECWDLKELFIVAWQKSLFQILAMLKINVDIKIYNKILKKIKIGKMNNTKIWKNFLTT